MLSSRQNKRRTNKRASGWEKGGRRTNMRKHRLWVRAQGWSSPCWVWSCSRSSSKDELVIIGLGGVGPTSNLFAWVVKTWWWWRPAATLQTEQQWSCFHIPAGPAFQENFGAFMCPADGVRALQTTTFCQHLFGASKVHYTMKVWGKKIPGIHIWWSIDCLHCCFQPTFTLACAALCWSPPK